ncbi:MAG: DUF2726 domain-containing protein [Acidobacteriota bacterium]
MKTKRLFNTSEYKTVGILRRALQQDTEFFIYPELPLNKVIEAEKGDDISKKEVGTLNTASFDFTIYNRASFPQFAIEFDGPPHVTYEKKRQTDIRKNRLCGLAGLPLLRIGDAFLNEYEKTSLLEYVIGRFVAWSSGDDCLPRGGGDQVERDIHAPDHSQETEYEDDPSIMFDLGHPFPASIEVAKRLYRAYGIVTSETDGDDYDYAMSRPSFLMFSHYSGGSNPIGDHHRKVERGYELRTYTRQTSGKCSSEQLHTLNETVMYQWQLPTTDHRIVFHGIPGTSMWELAEHLCDFRALCRLEKWAPLNLQGVISKTPDPPKPIQPSSN